MHVYNVPIGSARQSFNSPPKIGRQTKKGGKKSDFVKNFHQENFDGSFLRGNYTDIFILFFARILGNINGGGAHWIILSNFVQFQRFQWLFEVFVGVS